MAVPFDNLGLRHYKHCRSPEQIRPHVLSEKNMKRIRLTITVLVALLVVVPIAARQQATPLESGLLTLDTIFTYSPEFPGEVQWQADGSGYFLLEPSAVKERLDLVRYDAATGAKAIVVSADKLVPPGASSPLAIEKYDFSPDGQS